MRRRAQRKLREYEQRRDFGRTPEPPPRDRRVGKTKRARPEPLQFVVQQHAARRLHYDFRLELDGVLKSWAVPKGPSLDTSTRRMAVETEDHPLEYAGFEGVIPKGEYGGGAVVVWDRGRWEPIGDARVGLAKGKLEFRLFGAKLSGRWHLVRLRERGADRGKRMWLLIKGRDEATRSGAEAEITERAPASVLTGRDLAAVARAADRSWSSKKGKPKLVESPPRPSPAPSARSLPRQALPRSPELQLATLVGAPPSGPEWVHELKVDGYRICARIEKGSVRLLTRSGKDWTDAFAKIARTLEGLPVDSALLDGEIIVKDAEGRSRFQLVQNALEQADPDLRYQVFDLLHLDGFDVRPAPLVGRKELLQELLANLPPASPVELCAHTTESAPEFFAKACQRGEEGIVCKLASAPYTPGRTRSWLKVKCRKRQEFVVVGFTEPRGARVGLGALLLAVNDAGGSLRYAGKVGTGFDAKVLHELRVQLTGLERKESPLTDPNSAERGAHWVEPLLVAEVEFAEWTNDGKVRHPSFIALRTDKTPAEIRREVEEPVPPPKPRATRSTTTKKPAAVEPSSEVAGVRLSHPDRVYWPDLGVTKRELAGYWEAVAERALPGLARRPLSLVRCPDGTDRMGFFQKHATASLSKHVARVEINPGEDPYVMVTDVRSLVSLVQIGVIELHPWGSRADAIEKPDLFVLDLDPDPAVSWRTLAETAQLLRAFLEDLGFVPFLRTTGGKGLHLVVPIARRPSWDDVKSFTRSIALRLVREAPGQYTAEIAKAKRSGKILIDYLRNQRDATAIASYSPRARPGAPVAMPLAWDELDPSGKGLPRWSVREAPARLAQPDPWAAFEDARRPLDKKTQARVRLD